MVNKYSELLTVIVPTFNREKYLRRLLDYYCSCGLKAKFIILDSSETKYNVGELKQRFSALNLQYISYPFDIVQTDKMKDGFRFIETKYSLVNPDDDFFLIPCIQESIKFLEENPKYSCARGMDASFFKYNGQFQYNVSGDYEHHSIIFDSPIERYRQHFLHYTQTAIYAVQRTDNIIKEMNLLCLYSDDLILAEYLWSMSSIILGKMKVFDRLYRVAQTFSPTNQYPTFRNMIVDGTFDRKFKNYKTGLCELYENTYHEPSVELERTIDETMKEKLESEGINYRRLKILSAIRRTINSLGLLKPCLSIKRKLFPYKFKTYQDLLNQPDVPYFDPLHPDHEEFMKIKSIIEKHGV